MVTIEATGAINGNKISWLFDAENITHAVIKAKRTFNEKGLAYRTYIIV